MLAARTCLKRGGGGGFDIFFSGLGKILAFLYDCVS